MGKWLKNVLVGFDQWVNTWMGGDPDETISSTLGKLKRAHGGNISFKLHPFAAVVDWGLDKIDPGHSLDSIEGSEDLRTHSHTDGPKPFKGGRLLWPCVRLWRSQRTSLSGGTV